MVSTRSMERMTEADQTMLLLSLQREMVEMRRKTEEVVQKNEQELQVLRRENEEMKKKLGEGGPSVILTNVVGKSYTSPPDPDVAQGTRGQPPPRDTEMGDESCLIRSTRTTRTANTPLPTPSSKSHCLRSGRVSAETDMTGRPTRTSIWTPTPPI